MFPPRPGSSGIVSSLKPFARTRIVCLPAVIFVKVSLPVVSVTPRRISSSQTMALGSVVMVRALRVVRELTAGRRWDRAMRGAKNKLSASATARAVRAVLIFDCRLPIPLTLPFDISSPDHPRAGSRRSFRAYFCP